MQYSRIPEAKADYARTGLVMLLDISDSCSQQAEMFAAIAAGAAGENVTVFFGVNGYAFQRPMKIGRRFSSYSAAQAVVKQEIEKSQESGYLTCAEFVAHVRPSRLIIFGDWDGKEQYVEAAKKQRRHGWFWFCNEARERHVSKPGSEPPNGWTIRNYFSRVVDPQALANALRKVR